MSNNVSAKLEAVLEQGRFSPARLAEILGVTFAVFERWLSGRARPKPAKRVAIDTLHACVAAVSMCSKHEFETQLERAEALRSPELCNLIADRPALRDALIALQSDASDTGTGVRPAPIAQRLEAANHAAVLRALLDKNLRGPLTEALVKDLHRKSMEGLRADGGTYSTLPRRVDDDHTFEPPAPERIVDEMARLTRSWNSSIRPRAIGSIAKFHTRFLMVHPFGDGNGRVARTLLAAQCLEQHYPPVFIPPARRAEYMAALRAAMCGWSDPLVLFFATEMQRSALVIAAHGTGHGASVT